MWRWCRAASAAANASSQGKCADGRVWPTGAPTPLRSALAKVQRTSSRILTGICDCYITGKQLQSPTSRRQRPLPITMGFDFFTLTISYLLQWDLVFLILRISYLHITARSGVGVDSYSLWFSILMWLIYLGQRQ